MPIWGLKNICHFETVTERVFREKSQAQKHIQIALWIFFFRIHGKGLNRIVSKMTHRYWSLGHQMMKSSWSGSQTANDLHDRIWRSCDQKFLYKTSLIVFWYCTRINFLLTRFIFICTIFIINYHCLIKLNWLPGLNLGLVLGLKFLSLSNHCRVNCFLFRRLLFMILDKIV